MQTLQELAGAEFSPCGKWRYKLWRRWDKSKPLAMCIGLNPSKGNAGKNDPTLRILIDVLMRLGYGGFYMTNLFAWVSSNPKDLLTCADALGENDSKLNEVAAICAEIIFCWGAFKEAKERIIKVEQMFTNAKCFGINKDGTPMHPMSLMYSGTTKTATLQQYKTN